MAFLTALFGSIIFLNQTEVGRAIKRAKDGKGGERLCLAERGITWLAAKQRQAEVVVIAGGVSIGLVSSSVGWLESSWRRHISWCMRAMSVPIWGRARTTKNPVLKYDWNCRQSSFGMGNIPAGSTKPPAILWVCHYHYH